MRLLALLCTGLASGARGNSWKIDDVRADLNCALDARPLIESGGQTKCGAAEIYQTMASVGTCAPCSSEPKGKGYFCENNEVVMCPAGYYCQSYTEKIECPEGKWCKAAFVEPMECRAMISCPKGSENQLAGLGFLIGLIWLLFCGCCCSCFIGYRERKEQEEMRRAAKNIKEDDVSLGAGLKQETPPVEIEFENMSMDLKSNGKCVLNKVTGRFPASSLVALMGPSGGGKTTFMNALCGRANYGTVTGEVKINGKKGGVQDIPKLVGFVPQDDIMHPDLTVTQVLHFNALLRLPASTKPEAIRDHVNSVVKVLGLDKIADNLVGDPDKRGISGGQKKRVNIGMELVAMPAVIFMDEPTSGLDGAATIQLAKCLGRLQKDGGLTIVCVIHQPRWAVFNEFTHLLLLGAGGSMVYCGDAKKIESYLTSINFRLPERENPADWMIDVVCGLLPQYESTDADAKVVDTFTAPGDLFDMWDKKYKGKNVWIGDEDSQKGNEKGDANLKDRKTPGRLRQTWIFLKRCARQFDKTTFFGTCCILFFCGVVFGMLYQSMAKFSYAGMMGVLSGGGFIFFMIATITARGLLGNERLQYMREFKSGTSSFSFWLAKVLWGLINVFMYPFAYALPLYWIMPVPAQDFGSFYWMYLLSAWYHMGLGMLLSVMFTNATTSLLMSVFVPMVLEIAFSGGMILIREMDGLTLFLSSLSCGRWFKHDLYLQELGKYPTHILDLQPVKDQLSDMKATMDDAGVGGLSLMILGLVLRVWLLIILVLLKYAEGNSCIGRIMHLILKCVARIGLSIPSLSPKDGDTVDSHPAMSRQPSLNVAKVAPSDGEP